MAQQRNDRGGGQMCLVMCVVFVLIATCASIRACLMIIPHEQDISEGIYLEQLLLRTPPPRRSIVSHLRVATSQANVVYSKHTPRLVHLERLQLPRNVLSRLSSIREQLQVLLESLLSSPCSERDVQKQEQNVIVPLPIRRRSLG